MTLEVIIMLGLLLFLITMFMFEPIKIDLIALSIPVFLVVLNPWTNVSASQAISGFSSSATITIGAMFVISSGVERSGLIQILGDKIISLTGKDETKQLAFIVIISGLIAGIINNTPVVALFIPMVIGIASQTNVSPSKFLIPLSYAAMMGGMLSLIGTSSNILASDILARELGRGYSMFEFTIVGIIVLFIGVIYIITIGRHLIPARLDPKRELTEKFELVRYLSEVEVRANSSLIDKTIKDFLTEIDYDLDVVRMTREGEKFFTPLDNKSIQEGDRLIVRADHHNLINLTKKYNLKIVRRSDITQEQFEAESEDNKLVEIVIPHGSFVAGQTLKDVNFLQRYRSSILGLRHGEETTHNRLEDIKLTVGDVLLLSAGDKTLDRLRENTNFIISNEISTSNYRSSKMFTSLGILAGVILLATFNFVPIVIAALAGVIAMVISGCLKANEVYEAINWDVIFLLSGLIPLGIAMENTGAAEFIAEQILNLEPFLSPLLVLILFYLITAIFASLMGNAVSVILMMPIALNAANQLSLNPFAFALVVTFAASSGFLTPIGYQTNLMVYSPGGYKFYDYFIVGAPLQLILTIVVPTVISFIWGL
ncbi:MAG: SLC13 family permease [Bacillota bacterium]